MCASGDRISAAARARPPYRSRWQRATAGEAAAALGKQGICVWDGHFYAARAVQVLKLEERGGLLRTGISMYSTRDDLQRLLAGIEQLTLTS